MSRPWPAVHGDGPLIQPVQGTRESRNGQAARNCGTKIPWCRIYESATYIGDVVGCVLQALEKFRPDLLVMGIHDLGRVARHCGCSPPRFSNSPKPWTRAVSTRPAGPGAFVARPVEGRRRAAFWRKLGFPNLVLARAAKARKRQKRLKKERFELARAHPFAIPDDRDYLLELDSRRSRRRR